MVKKQLERLLGKYNGGKVLNIPLREISRNPFQPRREFNEIEIKDLARSIEIYGVLQPIVVRKARDGYQLIAGERRYRACRLLGVPSIPAIIQEMSDQQAAEVSLIENLQRKDLNYLEEAAAYAQLISEFGLLRKNWLRRLAGANRLLLIN
jgi:ParB family chromosome partitioning protein